MHSGFRWCPHCGKPHGLDDRHCTETGIRLEKAIHRPNALGRMTPGLAFQPVDPPASHPAKSTSSRGPRNGLIGTVLDGKYRLVRLIGSGGMGQVFEAENIVLKRPVAVKLVANFGSSEALVRLQIEARLVAAIQHPNICDVYDVGALPNVGPYVVLERLRGATLAERLTTLPRMSTPTTLDVFMQMLSGLDAAHRANIIHRDLKPQNVFLVNRRGFAPVVKLLDFGFAKDLNNSRTITRPGKMLGTPQYMAPEQLRAHDVDARADVFAVGIMMYEALTGVHPFAASSLVDIQMKILRETPVRLCARRPDLPYALEDFVMCAMAKQRGERFESAHEMQTALARCVDAISRRRRVADYTPPSSPSWMPPAETPSPASGF